MAWVYNDVNASDMLLLTIDEIDNKTLVMDYMEQAWYDNTDPQLILKSQWECPIYWFHYDDYFYFAPMRWMILSWRGNIIEDQDWKFYYSGRDSKPTPGRGAPYPW